MQDHKSITCALGVLELSVGAGAVFGGGALAVAPSGALLGMPLELLDGSPFRTYLVPGLLLCFVVGGCNLAAGWLALRRRRPAVVSAFVAGAVLVAWISVQIRLIGYRHPIQAAYLLFGCAILAAAVLLNRRTGSVS